MAEPLSSLQCIRTPFTKSSPTLMSRSFFLFLLTFFSCCLLSCKKEAQEKEKGNIMLHSELIKIYEKNGFDEVIISDNKGNKKAHYILVSRSDTIMNDIPSDACVLRVPLTSAVLDSEVYAGALEELGSQDIIKGMLDADFVTSPSLKDAISKGKVARLGQPSSPDIEKITLLNPEAVFLSYFEGMQTQPIDKTGTPVLKMYDLQESTPLGRAEWIKFIGKLVGKDKEAKAIFKQVAHNYETQKKRVGHATDRKKVITEIMYEGLWNVAGGKSYQSNMIKDAGGKYFKEGETSKVTLMLTPEQILKDGHDADVWIIRFYGNEAELRNVLNSDPIYKEIKAFRKGEIYFSDTSQSGLFREFPFHPDRLMGDYSTIFSNGTKENLKYFTKLNR